MIIDTKKLELGKTVYYVDIPTEKTVMCENLDRDDNFDENGNCKKDCFKDCCLPQASVEEAVIDRMEMGVDEDGTKIIINGWLEEEEIFFTKKEAEEELDRIKEENGVKEQ